VSAPCRTILQHVLHGCGGLAGQPDPDESVQTGGTGGRINRRGGSTVVGVEKGVVRLPFLKYDETGANRRPRPQGGFSPRPDPAASPASAGLTCDSNKIEEPLGSLEVVP
jgi:hypothetical protein